MDWESFKFPLGSLVRHKAGYGRALGRVYVVAEQQLVRGGDGHVVRRYGIESAVEGMSVPEIKGFSCPECVLEPHVAPATP